MNTRRDIGYNRKYMLFQETRDIWLTVKVVKRLKFGFS